MREMWKAGFFWFAAVVLAAQGESYNATDCLARPSTSPFHAAYRSNELRLPSTLRELLAELMQEDAAVCGSDCCLEVRGKRHYFPVQFIDTENPCLEYKCNVRYVDKLHKILENNFT